MKWVIKIKMNDGAEFTMIRQTKEDAMSLVLDLKANGFYDEWNDTYDFYPTSSIYRIRVYAKSFEVELDVHNVTQRFVDAQRRLSGLDDLSIWK